MDNQTERKIADLQVLPSTKVSSLEEESEAVEILKSVRDQLENAEANRTKLVKPLNDHVKKINSEYRMLAAPFEHADKALRKAIVDFRASDAFREAEKKHEEAVRKVEDAQRMGASIQELVPLVEECNKLASFAPTTAGKSGELKFRKATRMEIVDPSIVPASYLVPDEQKILEDVRAGKMVPGVRSWEETTTALT